MNYRGAGPEYRRFFLEIFLQADGGSGDTIDASSILSKKRNRFLKFGSPSKYLKAARKR
jgi:hypothetical protein